MKKSLINLMLRFFGTVLILMLGLSFVACAPQANNDKESLSINKSSINILLYQTETLSVSYNGKSEISWSVSDDDVILVDNNGKITAKSVGSAEVIVSANDLTDKCIVTVLPFDESKFDIVLNKPNLSIYNGEVYSLSAKLNYDGIALSGVEYEYSVKDENVISINSAGKVTTKALGEASIIVKATYHEFEFSKIVNVNVISQYSICLEKYAYELYTKGEANNTSVQLNPIVKNRDENIDGISFTFNAVEQSQDIFSLSNNGVINALNAGTALVEISAIVDGESYSTIASITVLPATKTFDNEEIFIDLSEKTYNIEYSEYQINDVVLGAYIESDGLKTDIKVDGNQLTFKNIDAGNKLLVLKTRNENFAIHVDLWTAVIDTEDELELLYEATTGKYLLNKDLDLTSTEWSYPVPYNTFTGVFDGQNHKITGLNLTGNHGLFYNVGNGAIIKNLVLSAQMSKDSSMTGALLASVNGGATVSISNVNLTIFDVGSLNGGISGLVNSKAKLNVDNSTVLYYNVYSNTDNGAISARCTGTVNFTDTVVYTSLHVCGTKSTDGNSVKTANSLNEKAVENGIVVEPVKLDALNVNLDSTVINTPNSDIANGIYVMNLPSNIVAANIGKYYLFGKTLSEGEFTSSKAYTLLKEDIADMVGSTIELYFVDSNNVVYYLSHKLISELHLYQANIEELLNATDSKIFIKEDLNFGSYEYWATDAVFTGELDGEGHVIKNLKIRGESYNGKNSFGLFYQFGGKIKNVIFIDANIGNNAGVLGYSLVAGSDVLIEDVFVGQITGAYSTSSFTGGFIARINQTTAKMTVKNVIYSAVESSSKNGEFGFVSGFGGAAVTLENCYFIGGKNAAVGTRDGYKTNVSGAFDYYLSEIDFYNESKKEQSSIITTDFMKKAIAQGIKVVEITNTNFDVLLTATSGYYFLTEDIVMTNKSWSPQNKFAGVLNGNNFSIIDLKPSISGAAGGLFGYLSGATIKNLAMINVDTSNGVGVFGGRIYSNSTIENVFVSQKNIHSTYGGGLLRTLDQAVTLTLKNVVMTMKTGTTQNTGFIAGRSNRSVSLENCYFIGGNGQLVGVHSDYNGGTITGNRNIYESISAFKNDNNKVLTEFLATQVNKLV